MNSSWNIAQLGDIYEFSSGLSKSRSEFGSGYPFLGFKDVFYNSAIPNKLEELVQSNEKEQKKCSIKRGDVFLTRTSETMNELGMSCVALQDVPFATFNGFSKRLRPIRQDSVVPEYARYYFRSNIFRQKVNSMATMSTRASLNNEILQRLEIILPPKNDQKIIGHILGTFDEKIELNKKTNKNLEDIAKGLFKSWFIDFDPVKAKSEGRSTGLPDEISDLFPDSFEETELGGIPKNWKFFELDEIAEFQNGYAFKSKEYIARDESSLEIFRMGYIHRGGGFKEDNSPVFVDSSSKGYQKKYSLKKDDLTIAMTDMKDKMAILGCCALVEESNRFLLNQRVGKIRVKNCKILSSAYLYLHMNYPTHVDQIRSRSNSGVQVNLSTDVIKSTPILIPDKLVMEKFSKISNELFSNIFKNNKMTKTIVEMRNILLPKLISGELRIPDAKKMIEEAGI